MDTNVFVEYYKDKLDKERPSSLFKYRSGAYDCKGVCNSINALKKNEIWFSQATTMDDAFDCRIPISKEEALILFNTYHIDIPQVFRKKAFIGFYKDLNENCDRQKRTYLSCYSATSDSSIMWNYYASAYEGFCIEYDFELINKRLTEYIEKFIKIGEVIAITPVIYNKSPVIDGFIDANQVTIKNSEWKFEDEWRIVYLPNQATNEKSKKYIPLVFNDIKPKTIYIGHKVQKNSRLYNELYSYCIENEISLKKKEIRDGNFGFINKDIL